MFCVVFVLLLNCQFMVLVPPAGRLTDCVPELVVTALPSPCKVIANPVETPFVKRVMVMFVPAPIGVADALLSWLETRARQVFAALADGRSLTLRLDAYEEADRDTSARHCPAPATPAGSQRASAATQW